MKTDIAASGSGPGGAAVSPRAAIPPAPPAVPPVSPAAPELRLWQRLLYAGAIVGGNLTEISVATWVMYFYAPPAGRGQALAPISLVAAALVVGRVTDAVVNPVVGFWSDRSRNPKGRRLPFLAYTAVPMVAAFIAVWFPPVARPSVWNGLYAAALISVFYFAFAAYFCPHGALLPEITHHNGERVSISVFTAVAMLVGTAFVGVSSGILVNRFGFRLTGVVIGLLALPFLLGPLVAIREKPPAADAGDGPTFREAVLLTLRNKPFVLFQVSTMGALLAQSILMGAMPYFITVVVRGTESQMGYLLGGSLLVAMVTFPLVTKMSEKWGKARVYQASLLYGAFILASLFFIGRFDLPISPLGQTLVIVALSGLGFAPSMALPAAILADTIDYEYERTGQQRAAMYLGIQGVIQKSSMALGPVIVSALFTWFGYSVDRPLGVYLVGPAGGILLFVGWLAFRGYPLKDR